MKSWEEKQKKVSDEANGKSSGLPPPSGWQAIIDSQKKWIDSHISDALIYGSTGVKMPPTSNTDPLAILPNGITSGAVLRARSRFIGDSFDKYLFGTEDADEKDLRLPAGFSYGSYSGFDPAFEKKPICCQPEDFVNIGFAHDKWVCKVCDKEKGS